MNQTEQDERFREIILSPLRVCADYKPAFGTTGADEIDLSAFQSLYGSNPLYHWLGLDSPLMYAAHKAAGGMTSIYRQIGIGCERLVRSAIAESFGLTEEEARWSYQSERSDKKIQTLELDARIDRTHLANEEQSEAVAKWLNDASALIRQHRELSGAVFEVRQGYKSADSKRQNADLRFGLASYDVGYLPVVMVVSTQVSQSVISRYRQSKLLILTGTLDSDPTTSTFGFFDNVVGYSLSQFFERNAERIRTELREILDALLSP
jgi:hypothetical protein